jgi:type II secretory pathway component PulM
MRLSRRDASALLLGTGTLLALGFWLLVYQPVREHIDLLKRKVEAKQSEDREVRDLAQRLNRLAASTGQIEERLQKGKNFSILTYLEKVAVELDLRRRITQMRGKGGEVTRHFRENAIEIRMEAVPLPQLVKYLYLLEHPKEEDANVGLLRVRQLRLKPSDGSKRLLDATFQVSGYELLEKT